MSDGRKRDRKRRKREEHRKQRQNRDHGKREAGQAVAEKLERLAKQAEGWRKYINPHLFPHVLHVSPAVERLMSEGFPGTGAVDVLQGCASLATRVLPQLHATAEGRECSQAEYIVQRPFRAALHLVLWRGEVYMSDEEILPYA